MSWYGDLGVPAAADERSIKRAYARLIKQYRPETHPLDFARVREAYETAMQQVRRRVVVQAAGPREPPAPPGEQGEPAREAPPSNIIISFDGIRFGATAPPLEAEPGPEPVRVHVPGPAPWPPVTKHIFRRE